MPRLYLVRHGHAAATFSEHADPGLDALGHDQATTTAARLIDLEPLALLSSPLARAKETAAALVTRLSQASPSIAVALRIPLRVALRIPLHIPLRIDARIAEIPSPTTDLVARTQWLQSIMGAGWSQQSATLQSWRAGVVECLLEQTTDTVIFSHFIAINVAVGAALADDRVVVFRPDNASVTIIDTVGGELHLVKLGDEAASQVN